ncbi:ribulokinase [Puniceicoccaceae bacterium K14]|nr:ribulokinase [Puniceicoccaceae bacterium K14]
MAYTIGVDYGSNSVRSIVVRCCDGVELGVSVYAYPSGEAGILLDKNDHNLARQHPGDYLEGIRRTVREAVLLATKADQSFSADRVVGIGVDSTGSSPIPVDANNMALALKPEWRGNWDAECWLWKDHTSFKEAARITALCAEHRPEYIAKCGNQYSSEWFWAKIWHCLNVAPEVFDNAYSWVEFCDWIPSVLSGVRDPHAVKRGICAAGHKALYSNDWGGLPDEEFLAMLDPKLAALRGRLYDQAYDASEPAGFLSGEWSDALGLPMGIPIAIGAFDVHYGSIGSGIEEGVFVKVIGTSTCDCGVVKSDTNLADIPGVCGVVDGSILPGYFGIEAGQSAVGDIFAWFVKSVCRGDDALHAELTEEANRMKPGESGLLALDWNNGNRTVLVDPLLTGALIGQTLHTSQAEIYRALIEATAFGARMIMERIESHGVPIERLVCTGGIAEKNPMLMQIYADVCGREIRISQSEQTCALGSAIVAAVLASSEKGGFDDFEGAQAAMSHLKEKAYAPIPENQEIYESLFSLYRKIHDSFGGVEVSDLGRVMKDLLSLKEKVRMNSLELV